MRLRDGCYDELPRTRSVILAPSWTGAGRTASPDPLRSAGDRLQRCTVEMVSTSEVFPSGGDFDDYARNHGLDRVNVVAGRLSRQVLGHLRGGRLPITIGGDHTLAIGGFAAMRSALGPGARIGLVWVDAHADLNTHETSETHNCHGMQRRRSRARPPRKPSRAADNRGQRDRKTWCRPSNRTATRVGQRVRCRVPELRPGLHQVVRCTRCDDSGPG
jgi:arginase family enzyme